MFQIKGFADYYAMLVDDFDEFMNETHSARRAIHCAITANHMKDWVWNDLLMGDEQARRDIGVTDKVSFYNWLGTNVWYGVLRDVAEGAKHFDKPLYQTQLVGAEQGFGLHGRGYLVIDLGEGAGEEHRFMPAANILDVIVRFWRDFFVRFRPDLKLRHSSYHSDYFQNRRR